MKSGALLNVLIDMFCVNFLKCTIQVCVHRVKMFEARRFAPVTSNSCLCERAECGAWILPLCPWRCRGKCVARVVVIRGDVSFASSLAVEFC